MTRLTNLTPAEKQFLDDAVAAAERAAESDDAAECCRAADSSQAVESPFHAYLLDPTM